jgi:3-oxoacyl-[acyl-carrier protein] reductase
MTFAPFWSGDMGQVALITGGSRGIGKAIASALKAEGFALAINDLPGETLEATANELGALALPFDVTDLTAHPLALAKAEAELGPLTTLINNAGVGVMSRGDPLDITPESYDRCLNVNTRAPFFLTQAFARQILSRPRPDAFHSIVTITSSNASAVAERRGEYCVSKAGAAMMSKLFAVRLGRENIACFDVRPGLIETEMTAPVIESYKTRAAEGLTLIPRVGQPQEVGTIVASLASGKLPYVTGQVVYADGGMLVERF